MKLRPEFAHLKTETVGRGAEPGGPLLVVCCDETYNFPARVTLASVLLNSASRAFETVVLADRFGAESVADLDRLGKRLGAAIHIVHVDQEMLSETYVSPHLARATFWRLMLADIFDCDRLIYLDSDMIVQIEVSAIWEEFRPDGIIGGVPAVAAKELRERMGAPATDVYVNAGTLLVNCEAWRNQGATAICAEWIANHPDQAVFADQDVINYALAGRVYAISQHWNVNRNDLRRQGLTDLRQLGDQERFKGIFHYSGPQPKPWCRWADPWSQDLYLHYARIVGLPQDYWTESQTPREALAEAHWAEQRGDLAKANGIYRRIVQGAMEQARAAGQNQAPADAGQPS